MLNRKLWRTMGKYKAQFISMIIMILLGVGVFVGFNMEWYSIQGNVGYFHNKTHFADYVVLQESGFSAQQAQQTKDIEGIEDVSRFSSIVCKVNERKGDTLALTVTENENVSFFTLEKGEEYDPNGDGIWLSDKYAAANNVKIGDDLTLSYNGIEIAGKVVGLIKASEYTVNVRDNTEIIPNYDIHGYAYISPKKYETALEGDYYPQLNILSSLSKKDFSSKINTSFDKTMLILSKDERISHAGPQGEIEEGQTMGSIIPVIFLLIGVLTMVTTMHRLTANEKIQIGTLKALGFKDKTILLHYICYALIVGVVGSLLGIGMGYGIAAFIMAEDGSMGMYLDMPEWKLYMPWICWLVIAIVIVTLVLICFLSTRQMLKGNAAQTLLPYSPKKVKPMLIEKTKLFHKLSFASRWNLRDLSRHKARMFMTVFGVFGCILIVLSVFGMYDTVQAFVNDYYDDANNYASIINLNKTATAEEKDNLISLYDGDSSASLSIQIEEKAITLMIYDGKSDKAVDNKLRLLDKKSRYVDLANDGAYICLRVAEDYKLKVGDTVKVSPYGSNIIYTLKVAGIIRNLNEGITITNDYANALGIDYSIDSIYTDTVKDDIETTSAIYNVKSKDELVNSFSEMLDLMILMICIFILVAIILGIVVLYNLGIMNYTERYRELATLKVLGFKDKKISSILIIQNLWTSIAGIIIGIPSSVVVLNLINKALMREYEMPTIISPFSFIISIAIMLVMTLGVSWMLSKKNKKIDMVQSLKGRE